MKKRLLSWVLLCLLLPGCLLLCTACQSPQPAAQPTASAEPVAGAPQAPIAGQTAPLSRFSMFFFDTFDTMITIIGYAPDQATFDRVTGEAEQAFWKYHQLFDAYHPYEGIQNIFTVNRDAAKAPVQVGEELFDMLLFARDWQSRLHGAVNIALGPVLRLWHDVREQAETGETQPALPTKEALAQAAQHVNMDNLVLDEQARTVFFKDPLMRLDVGAVAKGYAAERVAQQMLASAMPSFIINAGGNVRAGHAPAAGKAHWGVGLQDPNAAANPYEGEQSMDVLFVENTSVVTSGDYQRFFEVDGLRYHHIIDPATGMPAGRYRAVTVQCQDSGMADILSTALFILPQEEGLRLAQSLPGVEVMWVLGEGEAQHAILTDGMKAVSRNQGAENPEQ